MKRVQRKMTEEHKRKISESMKKANIKRNDETRKKISESMKKYWASIPYENNDENMKEDAKSAN